MKRSTVTLKKSNKYNYTPKFSDCLLDCFHKNKNSVRVKCSLDGNHLILEENKNGYELRHSPECSFKLLSKPNSSINNTIEAETKIGNNNYVSAATSVIIESADNHILLTKRAYSLKTSPGAWVTPGGYIENNETIFDAGIREVKEETGLDISNENLEILCLWENIYPLLLGIGPPKSHAIIVYVFVKLNETHENLISKLVLNPDEVDSFCWIDGFVIAKSLNKNENVKLQGKQYIFQNNKLIKNYLDVQQMFNKFLWTQSQPYSGINFALRKWNEKIKCNILSKF